MNSFLTKPVCRYVVGALFASLNASAFAHQIWLEQAPARGARPVTAHLYFGEYGGNLREASPGLLDKFVKPSALRIAGSAVEPLVLVKQGGAFDLSAGAAIGQSLVAEDAGYPISERKNGEQTVRSLYHPAARLITDWKAREPLLKLDLVPTGQRHADGHELKAFFNGKPLVKAKVALVTAAGWAQELQTSDDGSFRVALPWRGTYVLELSHSDPTGGEREGQRFDRATYVTSLTVMQAKGLPPLPAAQPAPPNKLN